MSTPPLPVVPLSPWQEIRLGHDPKCSCIFCTHSALAATGGEIGNPPTPPQPAGPPAVPIDPGTPDAPAQLPADQPAPAEGEEPEPAKTSGRHHAKKW